METSGSKRIKLHLLFLLFILVNISLGSFANVELPAVFSDRMVLQQKSKVEFWGWATPGEVVLVEGSWSNTRSKATTDGAGKWRTTLQTPTYGGPYTINIQGNNTLQINDVLVGEVWICSGQSNMVFSLKSSDGATAEIAKANFPSIRYFSVNRQFGTKLFKDAPGSIWEKTSPETASHFSAVSYYFAKKIHGTLNVPVGIIYAAWGGTPAEAWTPPEVLQNDISLSVYFDRWKYIQENAGKDSIAYYVALDQWEKNKASSDSIHIKMPDEPQTFYYYKRPWREPGVLFNGMIDPVIPYTIKGFLWYQGESNVGYSDEYFYLFSKMIQGWRERWKTGNFKKILPFYFVQIAPFGYSNMDAAARLRRGQYEVTKKIEHTGMVATVDLGDMKNIHFTHKKEVGERLALIALAKDYGFKRIDFTGPEFKKVQNMQGKIHVTFDEILFTYDHKKAGGFEIGHKSAGSDSLQFVKAESLIKGNEVIIWNDQIKDPSAVRYAWLKIGEANLVNSDGLPAVPFEKHFNY